MEIPRHHEQALTNLNTTKHHKREQSRLRINKWVQYDQNQQRVVVNYDSFMFY